MRFDDAPDELALRRQLREYFTTLVPADDPDVLGAPGANAEHGSSTPNGSRTMTAP